MLKTLESTYDIPFVLESEQDDYQWTRISPAGARERMFSIKITNISDVRLHIDFLPQTFSANLIEAMGRASGDSKTAFCDAVKLLQARGAQVFMSINRHSIDPCDIMTWPDDKWSKIDYYWYHDFHCTQMIVRYRSKENSWNIRWQFTPW